MDCVGQTAEEWEKKMTHVGQTAEEWEKKMGHGGQTVERWEKMERFGHTADINKNDV
jgi:hypothetical protein